VTTAIIDLDMVKYTLASVGEETSLKVTNKNTQVSKVFKNKTAFWGRKKKEFGGELGDWLSLLEIEEERSKEDLLKLFDFEILQEQTEPLDHILHSCKVFIDKALKDIGAKKIVAFAGKGDSFRVELSTLKEYKGPRKGMVKPLLLDKVTDYLVKKYKGEVVTGIEADDKLVWEYIERTQKGEKCVVIAEDKDMYGTPIKLYNPKRPSEGIINCNGFGELRIEGQAPNEKIKGHGRLFKYFQIISDDDVDNYKANCCSDVRWGAKSAYKALKDCTTDKEAWQVMVDVFKKLYPEPKEVEGWRGDQVGINWLYVMQEMVDMAHIHRKQDDFIDVETTLKKLEIEK